MTTTATINLLRARGIYEGRCISLSKTIYTQKRPTHCVVFNAQLWTERGCILRQVDLDLAIDAEALEFVAGVTGDDLFVLEENPTQREPNASRRREVLAKAVWFTQRQRPDQFIALDRFRTPGRRWRLNCSVGTWLGKPAFEVDSWDNGHAALDADSAAAVRLLGAPPRHFGVVRQQVKYEAAPEWPREPRELMPRFHQQSGPLELLWFSEHIAMPSAFHRECLAAIGSLAYHHDPQHPPIHISQHGKFLGLVWPAHVRAPQIEARAQAELNKQNQ